MGDTTTVDESKSADKPDLTGTNQKNRIVRVFFSSPFGGLEAEREELTKKYWPRLSSACSKAGYEFVPVDLRWGITTEKTSNAVTLEVCLREVERSDVFVGFFGQRYGWNGVDDDLLQRNFDVAAKTKPWLNNYRDRSATEVEFLHGHLNRPGDKPACFFFRNKAYDKKMLTKLKSEGKNEEARKYAVDSDGPKSEKLLNDLKRRVKATEGKVNIILLASMCLVYKDNYPDPQTGARLMFEAIQSYLEETVLVNPLPNMSEREKERMFHKAYYISRLGVGARRKYIGGDRYINEIDRHVIREVKGYAHKPLLILGGEGYGKTTLLANWLHRHQRLHKNDIIAHHFVGCTPTSSDEKEVLISLLYELIIGLEEKSGGKNKTSSAGHSSKESGDTDRSELQKRMSNLKKQTVYNVFREFCGILQKISDCGKRAIIIIDAIDKMDDTHVTQKELYWLPTEIPEGVSMLVSSLRENTSQTNELIRERHWDTLTIAPIKKDDRKKIVVEMLSLRGKELTDSQLQKIISKEQTANVLFLKIFVQELCNFGDFWRLNDHLDFLLEANSTTDLFGKILERFEVDFNPKFSKKNIVCKVMCTILVSRSGVSEQEIKEINGLTDNTWSAIFFAMENYVIDKGGLYDFEFEELVTAVKDRYVKSEEVWKEYTRSLTNYYLRRMTAIGSRIDSGDLMLSRIAHHLPWLLTKLEDYDQLKICLSHLGIFKTLYSTDEGIYDLYGYWNATKAPGSEISALYMKALEDQISQVTASDQNKNKQSSSWNKNLYILAYNIGDAVCEGGHQRDSVPILQRALSLMQSNHKTEELMYTDPDLADTYVALVNKLASIHCDLENFEESEKLHHENLKVKEKLQEKWKKYKPQIATTMNGLAVVNQKQRKYDQAMEYYKKCLEIYRSELDDNDRLIGDTLNNIGSLLLLVKNFDEAVECLKQAIQVYDVCYFGMFHPDVGGALNNLAICYRNLQQLDKAQPIYERAYNMTVKALGERHPDTAEKLVNWGVFHQNTNNYDTALEMYKKALDIYKECFGDEHIQTLFVMENIAITNVLKGSYDEAHIYFNKAGEVLFRQGRIETSLPDLNRRMLTFYVNNQRTQDATRLLERILGTEFSEPSDYVLLDEIDKALPENRRPTRRHEHTMEYALTRFPADEDILKYVLRGCLATGDDKQVIATLKNGKYECGHYNEVYAEFLNRNLKTEAVNILLAAKEMFPDDWVTPLNLAMTYASFGETDAATELLENALKIHPDNVHLHECMGRLLVLKGKIDMAKQYMNRALELTGDDEDKAAQIRDIISKLN
ncbi:TPR repeat-containing protein DDB_G0287407-like [Ptychodera flava]|uniref:TPR repeat-containing protein DDB_G0287407-like n=1 Tax=Ptychodera flava TaxID=63121 RepID=UPI00396A51BB